MSGMAEHKTRPHARLPPCFLGMDVRITSQLNGDLIRKLAWVIDMLGLFYDMLFMVVCTTSHSQMPGRLVQELNVCTVCGKSSPHSHSSIEANETIHMSNRNYLTGMTLRKIQNVNCSQLRILS